MHKLFLLAAASLLPVSAMAQTSPTSAQIDPRVSQRIDRILKRTPLIDGHNDLPWALRGDFGSKVEGLASGTDSWTPPLMTDMARLRAGRVGGQFWSVYIDGTTVGDEAIRVTLEQIDTAHRIIDAYPETLRFARSADEMEAAHKAGRIGSMLGIEGGRQIGGSMAALRKLGTQVTITKPPLAGISRSTSSGTLRGCGFSPAALEWEKITGALDAAIASRIVAGATWLRSTSMPRRFISFTTSTPNGDRPSYFG